MDHQNTAQSRNSNPTVGVGRGLVHTLRRAALASSVAVIALGVGSALTPKSSHIPANAAPVSVQTVTAPSFADVVDAVRPAVVSVRVKQRVRADRLEGRFRERGAPFDSFPEFRDLPEDHPLNRFFRRYGENDRRDGRRGRGQPHRFGQSQGSGFIISEDGYVVTNNHVIENGQGIVVVLDSGEELDATLVGADPRTDLAVLKIDDDRDFTYVAFSDADIRVGEWVVSMGNPFGLGGTVTAGIVSARGRDIGAGPYDDFLQIDAAVNRGNSGGPTFSIDGRVIGVNTAIFSPNGGNVGIAFAIPAATASSVVADLIENGAVTRGWLGVQIQPVTPEIAESLGLDDDGGAIVAEVTEDSPAEEAGLETGDTVLAVDGETIDGPKDLARTIAAFDPGERVDVVVWRDGARETVTVELGELPGQIARASVQDAEPETEPTSLADLGLDLTTDSAGRVVIADVDPRGEAGEKGLRPGDRILQVNGEDVTSPADVMSSVDDAQREGRTAVLFLVQSGERPRFVALDLKDA